MNLKPSPHIYVIDRSETYRRIIEGLLKALGYSKVKSFAHPKELLDFNIRPHIIIMEHEADKSEMSGLDFFRLHGTRELSKTKFIFLSSNINLDIAVSALRMGAFDYIVKSKIGLERLTFKLELLVNNYISNYRKTIFLRGTVFSLGMLCIVFLLAILLYTK